MAAVVTAVVVVVRLEDSNHILALCLLQLKAYMLNVLKESGNEMKKKNACKNDIPLNVEAWLTMFPL